jgi:peptidoglycan/xylan/chitin deacetylase (PgdA/CDA1 family)/GT2 family glycosyltransferase
MPPRVPTPAAEPRPDLGRRLSWGRLAALAAWIGLVVFLARWDLPSALLLTTGVIGAYWVLRRKSRRRLLATVAAVVAATLLILGGVAVAQPVQRYPARQPHLVPTPIINAVPDHGRSGPEFLGFVTDDVNGASTDAAQATPYLSTLAVTNLTLGTSPGTLTGDPAPLAELAHRDGASGLLTVWNYDPVTATFDGARAAAALTDGQARGRLVDAVRDAVMTGGWDGAVIDFEQVGAGVHTALPAFISALATALPGRRVLVTVPAFASTDAADAAGYDLPALGRAADRVIYMTYDQHELSTDSGPVAGLPWVKTTLDTALATIPASKILLGVAGYGYRWSGQGQATAVTANEAAALEHVPGVTAGFDPIQAERHLRMPDGGEVWYADEQSLTARSQLALDVHLAGVALWKVDGAARSAVQNPGFAPTKRAPVHRSPIRKIDARGVVALTFDDGPDPTWTPQVLAVLAAKHVPATFFVIGRAAQDHPDLVRAEIGAGFIVGNHTFSHLNLSTAGQTRATADARGGALAIEVATGRRPALFRAPFGAEYGGDIWQSRTSTAIGETEIGWDVDAEDWQRPGVDRIVDTVVDGVADRSVVLLHDAGGDRAQTVAALPRIIDTLRSRGYVFGTVDQVDPVVDAAYTAPTSLAEELSFRTLAGAFRGWSAERVLASVLFALVAAVSLLRLGWLVPTVWAHRRRERRRPGGAGALPLTVSVIVPAYNEEKVISKTLASLGRLTYPVEVIVVDDGSTDTTVACATQYPVRVIQQPQTGKAAALNRGLAAATGDLIAIVDADSVLDPAFFDHVVGHFTDPAVVGVAGNVKVGNRQRLLARLQALEYIIGLNLDRRSQSQLNVIPVIPGAAGVFRRAAVLAAGGYPADTLVEDADLTLRLLSGRGRVVFEPRAVAYTEAPETVRDVLRQRRRWSYGMVQVAVKHQSSLLATGSGRFGHMVLPWLFIGQILVPVAGPALDVWLGAQLLTGAWKLAVATAGLSAVTDVIVAAVAVRLDREDPRLVAWAPAMRFVWRPLQLVAALQAMWRWGQDQPVHWTKVTRRNTVVVPLTAAGGQPSVAPGQPVVADLL